MYAATLGLLALSVYQICLQPAECFKIAKTSNLAGEISTQIVKGASVPNITAFPYYVGIMSGNSIKCNGALIDDDWVLTSAFCASLSKELTVALATHKTGAAPSFRMDIPPSNIFQHKDYNADTRLNDIALLKLPYTITLKTPFIKTIKYNKDKKQLFQGKSAVVSGFGFTEVTKSAVLLNVTMKVIANGECSTLADETIDPSLVCVAGANGEGPCQEDEGSPLVIPGKTPTLIGLFTEKDTSCVDTPKYRIFTQVAPFDKWITSTMSANK